MNLFSVLLPDNGLPSHWPALGKGLSSQSYKDLGTCRAIRHWATSLTWFLQESGPPHIPSYFVH